MSVPQDNRFASFDQVHLEYKKVQRTPILTTILIPKTLKRLPRNKYPVLVHWHGGGFIVGHRLFEGWLLEFALSKNAIIISPDHRLMPEANGPEIMSDVGSFWRWLHSTLPSLSSSWHAQPDLSRIACCGESAGGYLVLQSALMFPESNIKAMISDGAPLNFNVPGLKVPRPRLLMGSRPPAPRQAEALIKAYLKEMEANGRRVRTGCEPSELWEFAMCVFQQAYLPRFFGVKGRPELDLMGVVESDMGKRMKPLWVIHGEQDSMCPPICATGFVEKLQQVLPDLPVHLSVQPGDHMFDVQSKMKEDWIREGCQFIERFWP